MAALVVAWTADANAVTRITKIEFSGKSAPHQIMITGDGPIEFEKVENEADRQVILELKNATLANGNVGRRIDTSSFNSKVSLISPYNVESQNAVRIIVQLRDSAEAPTVAAGNRLFVGIDGEPDPAVIAAVTEVESSGSAAMANESTESAESVASSADASGNVPNYGNPSGKGQDGMTAEERIELATTARANRKYVGSRITIQVKEAAVGDVFRLIGEASGFNIILGPDVTGNITLSLVDVPWDLALDTILSTMKLGAERRGNVLRVATLATLTQEKQLEQVAKRAAEAGAPRITRIIPISYAEPQRLIPILQKFGGGSAGGGTETARDTIMVDDRTNSLVIQDIPENISRMAKMIELLDKPTPQILIESKIIEATEDFTRGIGGSLGLGKTGPAEYGGASFSNGNLGTLNTSDPFPDQTSLTGANSFFAAGFSISRIGGSRIRALLSFAESEAKTKIISSPRTLVLNRQSASIVQGTPVLVPITLIDSNTGLARVSNTVQSANLSLDVKPTVTNDGNVIMDLSISSDEPKPLGELSGIGNRRMKTQVVAESGTTIVIGGVYKDTASQGEGGYPGLRKIPIIGRLFGFENTQGARSELLIFVSPKIMNEGDVAQDADKATTTSGMTTDQG